MGGLFQEVSRLVAGFSSVAASAKYHRDYYHANRASILARRKRTDRASYRRLRVIVLEEKNKPCKDCNNMYGHWVMQFDHVHGTKVAEISTMVANRVSETRLRAEIAKCELVCANCHATRTYQRINGM